MLEENVRYPNVKFNISEFKMWQMRLANQHYGTLREIEELSVNKFFDLIHYENYLSKYQRSFAFLNRKK